MKKKQTDKSRDFEKIEKEGATLYTNARSLLGDKGQQIIDDVFKAFDYALKKTEEEFSKKKQIDPMDRINKMVDDIAKNPLYKSVAERMRSGVEELKELASEIAAELKEEDTDKELNEKQCEDCCKQCGGHCNGKCACDAPCEGDKQCTTCNKNSCDTLIENEDNEQESRSANFIRRRHLDYMNSLTDYDSNVDTPLPAALKRVAKQASDAVDKIDEQNNKANELELSAVEKEFIMDIMNRLIKVLDANFTVPEIHPDDEYNDYDLPDFQTYDDVLEHDDFRFTGIMDDMEEEPFGVALKVDLSKYPTEIAHRLINDVDNGRLIELLATYAGFDADNVFFESWEDERLATNMGEIFFILED